LPNLAGNSLAVKQSKIANLPKCWLWDGYLATMLWLLSDLQASCYIKKLRSAGADQSLVLV